MIVNYITVFLFIVNKLFVWEMIFVTDFIVEQLKGEHNILQV